MIDHSISHAVAFQGCDWFWGRWGTPIRPFSSVDKMGPSLNFSVRQLSPTTWFRVACSCCTGFLVQKRAAKRQRFLRRLQKSSLDFPCKSPYHFEGESCEDPTCRTSCYSEEDFQIYLSQSSSSDNFEEMWMDPSVPLERLVVNRRARLILFINLFLGWGSWATMIFLAFFYQFFTIHSQHFSYLSLPLLLSCSVNGVQLLLASATILFKGLYRTPFLMSLSSVFTVVFTAITAMVIDNDELFYAGIGMAAVQLVFWLAFSTGYGAVVSPWLHPFVPDEKWYKEMEERKLEEANPYHSVTHTSRI